MGLIRYSCSHISCPHEPIHVKFGVWGFSSCSTEIWSWKCWNAKQQFDGVTLWYCINAGTMHIILDQSHSQSLILGRQDKKLPNFSSFSSTVVPCRNTLNMNITIIRKKVCSFEWCTPTLVLYTRARLEKRKKGLLFEAKPNSPESWLGVKMGLFSRKKGPFGFYLNFQTPLFH